MTRRSLAVLLLLAAAAIGIGLWFAWPGRDDRTLPSESSVHGERSGDRAVRGDCAMPPCVRPADGPSVLGRGGNASHATAPPNPSSPGIAAAAPGPHPESGPRNECDDGDPCTAHDRIADGACTGEPFECDDNNPETVDLCVHNGCMFRFVGNRDAPVGRRVGAGP